MKDRLQKVAKTTVEPWATTSACWLILECGHRRFFSCGVLPEQPTREELERSCYCYECLQKQEGVDE